MPTVVISCRVPDAIAARLDALLGGAGLKNRSQAVGAAVLAWIHQREGGQTLEDRIVARVQETIRQELARIRIQGASTQDEQADSGPPTDKVLTFLRNGRR
jgi:metal-responsive CopG/Arc/MetJ family transcriptional regulator